MPWIVDAAQTGRYAFLKRDIGDGLLPVSFQIELKNAADSFHIFRYHFSQPVHHMVTDQVTMKLFVGTGK